MKLTQVKPSQEAKVFKPSNPDMPCLPEISVPQDPNLRSKQVEKEEQM